jgi:hypothetical protein
MLARYRRGLRTVRSRRAELAGVASRRAGRLHEHPRNDAHGQRPRCRGRRRRHAAGASLSAFLATTADAAAGRRLDAD